MTPADATPRRGSHPAGLERELGLASATALNMIDMIGVGPFITIPLILGAMGGPQAMLGWILGAAFALCDGLVWAELGAAMPGSGGSYRYLREIYGRQRLGRMLSFLYIWQLSFSAPLSIASGCVGLAQYAAFLWPSLALVWMAREMALPLPLIGQVRIALTVGPGTVVAMLCCIAAVGLLYRSIKVVGRLSKLLWTLVAGTVAWVIFTGVTHFDAARAFDFPAGAFHPDASFFTGLGAAMLVATYDYWGYYNVCFIGDEVREPSRTIPRALMLSIAGVAAIYLAMNISILGVISWRELAVPSAKPYVISLLMQRAYGPESPAAVVATCLIMLTAFASVFSLLLGYSRAPYAAAQDGNYFRALAHVDEKRHFPDVSLLALGAAACLACLLRLADLIAALVTIRIMLQFLVQTVGLLLLRATRPDFPRPFRMWFYPVPALLAMAGFIFVLISRRDFLKEVRYGTLLLLVGLAVYLWRAARIRQWPFTTGEGK
jgi:basic amino acid/polyamine antiporter, APA family